MVEFFQVATLIAATMAMGLMAGVFGLYSHTIMPGLGRTDDRTFVGAFQSIDKAIINPLFMTGFLGALIFTGAAALLHLPSDARTVLPWIVAALVLYLVAIAITAVVNVPLNNQLLAAGDPDRIDDLAAVREGFETKWVRWNIPRAVVSTIALGCLAWALVLHGRL